MTRTRIAHISFIMVSMMVLLFSAVNVSMAADDDYKRGQDLLVLGGDVNQLSLYLSPSIPAIKIADLPGGIIVHVISDPVKVMGVTWIRVRGYPVEGWASVIDDGEPAFSLYTDELAAEVTAQAEAAVKENPKDGEAFYHLGIVHMNHENYEAAIEAFSEASSPDSELTALILYFRGLAYYRLEQYDESLTNLNAAIFIDPEPVFFYTERGNVYSELGNPWQAIAEFDEAIRRNPYYLSAHNNRGIAFADMGYTDEALKEYNFILEQEPLYSRVYNNRAVVYKNLGEYQAAVKDLKRAMEIEPDYAAPVINLADTYRILGKYDDALAALHQALKIEPDSTFAYSTRALTYGDLGRLDEALADYQHVVELAPNDANGYYNVGTIYYQQELYELAIENLSRAIELNPSYLAAYQNRGLSYEGIGDYEAAIGDFNQAIAIWPDFVLAHSELCKVYFYVEDHEQAIDACTQTLEYRPDDLWSLWFRAESYGDAGYTFQAIADFQTLVELEPENAVLYYDMIGELYLEMEQYEKALETYELIVEIDPDYESDYAETIAMLRELIAAESTATPEATPSVAP